MRKSINEQIALMLGYVINKHDEECDEVPDFSDQTTCIRAIEGKGKNWGWEYVKGIYYVGFWRNGTFFDFKNKYLRAAFYLALKAEQQRWKR